jgi:CheY-like chemotaxis protein
MAEVVIVDDDVVALEVIADALRAAGHSVRAASSGTALMQALLEAPAEVVVLDVNLPGMSGDRLTKVLFRNLEPPLPKVILFSGMEASELRRLAAKLKVTGWVRKGAPKEDLLRAVEAAARFFRTQGQIQVPIDFSTPPIRQLPEPLDG